MLLGMRGPKKWLGWGPGLGGSMGLGAWGWTVVSLSGYAVWAFGGRAIGGAIGELGLYAVITLVFLSLAGVVLRGLVRGGRGAWGFLRVFLPAFLAYAVVWCGAWFGLGGRLGEWVGSWAGSAVFAAVVCGWFRRWRAWVPGTLVLGVLHAAGYFAGSAWMGWWLGPEARELWPESRAVLAVVAKLGWGLWHGLGFGLGMGYVFHRAQVPG